jgi:CubicO group peptidase (beta-lactamase class C family)
LIGFTVGKAKEEGPLNLSDKTSKYLGENGTSLTKEQQDKITVWHRLTMTSGK